MENLADMAFTSCLMDFVRSVYVRGAMNPKVLSKYTAQRDSATVFANFFLLGQ